MISFPARTEYRLGALSVAGLALSVLVAVFMPRFMAFAPAFSAILIAIDLLYTRQMLPAPRTEAFVWLLAISALALLSAIWSAAPAATFTMALRVVAVLLSGGLLLTLLRGIPAAATRRLSLILPLCYAVATALLAIDALAGYPLYKALHGLPSAGYFNASKENRGVIFCTLLYLPMLSFIYVPGLLDRSQRLIGTAVVTLPLLLALYGTESQSSQLAFAAGLCCLALFPYRWRAAWPLTIAILALAILTAPWLSIALYEHLAGTVNHAPFFGEGKGYGAERLEIWDFVSRYALHRPAIGFGLESTRMTTFDSPQVYTKGTTILHPHNFAIQLWMEFGVIGALLGAVLIGRLILAISHLPSPERRFALSTMAVNILVGAMTYGLWQGWWLGLLVFSTALTLLATGLYGDAAGEVRNGKSLQDVL